MTPHADIPPAFDADAYLAANPDLALSRDEVADHYMRIGRAEGRVASPLALRENLIAMIDDGRSVLEIGPFYSPLLRGPNIAYLDILDAGQLRDRAVELGADPAGCPALIDYVGGLELVQRRFDAVISSHAIEHQPDLVHHLAEVARILEPDGLFCLIIPDKRFCFDHYIAESTIAGVLQAHREQRRVHNLASVIEHVALSTHNHSGRHWAGDHGPPVAPDFAARVRNAIGSYEGSDGGYVDVHGWYFTPDSFRRVIDTLRALGLSRLEVAEVYDAVRDRNEFCAVLRLDAEAREHIAERVAQAEQGAGDTHAAKAELPPADQIFPWFQTGAEDRWESRLSHRGGHRPELVEAPVPPARFEVAAAICATWRTVDAVPFPDYQRELADALGRGDADAVAVELAGLGRAASAQGIFGGARQHERARSRQFAERLARWTHDKLVSLAEAVGVLPLENPETGPWGFNAATDPADLFRAVAAALDADLSPPAHIGGHLGIAAGDGVVLHMRMLDAIHAAWRLRQLSHTLGLGSDARIAEIGAGAGLTAFYAARLGLARYAVYDNPPMGAIQAYVLADEDIAICDENAFANAPEGSIDILFNSDTFPAMERAKAVGHLAAARRLAIPNLLSINQEAPLPDHTAMLDLISEAGGYVLGSRHRHWLRAGYVEELYVRRNDSTC